MAPSDSVLFWSISACSFIPLLVVVASRWSLASIRRCRRSLLANSAKLVRGCLWGLYPCARCKTGRATARDEAIAAKMNERRRVLGNIVAAVTLVAIPVRLVTDNRVEDCPPLLEGIVYRRTGAALVGAIWVAFTAVYMKASARWACTSSCPELLLSVGWALFDMTWVALSDPAMLLRRSAWNALHLPLWGISIRASQAFWLCLLWPAFTAVTHLASIEQGRVYLAGEAIGGSSGCTELFHSYAVDDLLEVLRSVPDGAVNATGFGSPYMVASFVNAMPVAETRIGNHAIVDVQVFVGSMIFFVVAGYLLEWDSVKALRAESKEAETGAFSEVLDRHCKASFALTRDFRVYAPSPRLDKLLGSSKGAVSGLDFRTLIAAEEDVARFEAFVDRGFAKGFCNVLSFDLRVDKGLKTKVHVTGAQFRGPDGEPLVLCAIAGTLAGGGNDGSEEDPVAAVLSSTTILTAGSSKGSGSHHNGLTQSSGCQSPPTGGGGLGPPEVPGMVGVVFNRDLSQKGILFGFDTDFNVTSSSKAFEKLVRMKIDCTTRPSCLPFFEESDVLVRSVRGMAPTDDGRGKVEFAAVVRRCGGPADVEALCRVTRCMPDAAAGAAQPDAGGYLFKFEVLSLRPCQGSGQPPPASAARSEPAPASGPQQAEPQTIGKSALTDPPGPLSAVLAVDGDSASCPPSSQPGIRLRGDGGGGQDGGALDGLARGRQSSKSSKSSSSSSSSSSGRSRSSSKSRASSRDSAGSRKSASQSIPGIRGIKFDQDLSRKGCTFEFCPSNFTICLTTRYFEKIVGIHVDSSVMPNCLHLFEEPEIIMHHVQGLLEGELPCEVHFEAGIRLFRTLSDGCMDHVLVEASCKAEVWKVREAPGEPSEELRARMQVLRLKPPRVREDAEDTHETTSRAAGSRDVHVRPQILGKCESLSL